MKASFRFALLLSLSVPALAQVYTPPAANPNPPANGGNAGNTTVVEQKPAQPAASPFGQELPFFNPSNEMISWNGSTWAATDNRAVAARFEGYLSQPEDLSDEAKQYRETIDQILSAISPHRPGGPKLLEGVKLLPKAASFPGDARICDTLSNAIYTAMLANRSTDELKQILQGLDEEKRRLAYDIDWVARNEKDPTIGEGRRVDTNGQGAQANQQRRQPAQQTGRGANSMRVTQMNQRLVEIEALRKRFEGESGVNLIQAKVQYQTLMAQLFLQRRFEHVVMASRFYTIIFNDGDNKLRIDKKSELGKIFAQDLGMSPTVSTLDSLANEAMRDVNSKVDGFSYLLDRGDLDSATKRLSEAFIVGEFLPSIRTLPRDQKQRIRDYSRKGFELIASMEVKDFAKAEILVAELKEMAKDFDSTKPTAAINTYTTLSNMHLAKAKNYMLAGRETEATEEVKRAMEVWPTNPKLKEVGQAYDDTNLITAARNDLRRLRSEQNYREIFRQKGRFIAASHGDKDLEDLMEQVTNNIGEIEGKIRVSDELSSKGQPYAAWETLTELRKNPTFAEDPVLGQRIVDLTPKVNDFVVKLENARKHAARGDSSSALSHYYEAQQIYPASDIVKRELDELIQKTLP